MLTTLKYPTPKRLRIIDGLIAEHVFGWRWFSTQGNAYLVPPSGHDYALKNKTNWTEGFTDKRWYSDKPKINCQKKYNIEEHFPIHYRHWKLPKFTTDRADNWLLIEELTKRFVTLSLLYAPQYSPPWQCQTAAANTMHVAVCLMALDRVKVELPWKQKPAPQNTDRSARTSAA